MGRLSKPWRVALAQLKCRDTKAPYVRRRVVLLARDELWSHPARLWKTVFSVVQENDGLQNDLQFRRRISASQ